MQRAVQAVWDLHWFRAAARLGAPEGLDVHLRLYPTTLGQIDPAKLMSKLEGLDPRRLVVAIDEQFLSGDPSVTAEGMARLRPHGVRLCLDVSDFGPACLEGLVMLRPERVLLAAEVIQAAVASRTRRAALRRFAKVVHALDLELLADGIDDAAERDLALELGVAAVSGSAAG